MIQQLKNSLGALWRASRLTVPGAFSIAFISLLLTSLVGNVALAPLLICIVIVFGFSHRTSGVRLGIERQASIDRGRYRPGPASHSPHRDGSGILRIIPQDADYWGAA